MYWRALRTLAVTKMAEVDPSSIEVSGLDMEQLTALGFLLATHRNVECLPSRQGDGEVVGELFSRRLSRQYERWFLHLSKHLEEQRFSEKFDILEYVVRWNTVFHNMTPAPRVFLANDFWEGSIDSVEVQKLLALGDEEVFASSLWSDFTQLLLKYTDDWVLQQLLGSMERYEKAFRAWATLNNRWAESSVAEKIGLIERPEKWMTGRIFSKSLNDELKEMLRLFQTAESVVWGLSREEQTLFLTLQSWLTARTAS